MTSQLIYPNVEPCSFPNCTGVKLPDGSGWRCSCGGRYHYFYVRAQIIRQLQAKFYSLPLSCFKDEAFRYFENLRRNVTREGIKDIPQQTSL